MDKFKILVVDDEPEIVRALGLRLKSNGYNVISAMDGLQATNAAIKEQPDLIILDIGMPAANGHVVTKRLRNSTKTCAIPIIYLTARTDEKDHQEAINLGVNKFITKPYDPDELIMTIESLL